MAFLDKWKWFSFQKVEDQSMQSWASENEKLALIYFLPKFDLKKQMYLNTEVVQSKSPS